MILSESDLKFIIDLLSSELRYVKYNKNTLYVLKLSESEKARRLAEFDSRIFYLQSLIDKLNEVLL